MRPGGARALAPAKVNLFLEVLARRPDGFHEIETAMLAIDLCDVVTIARTRDATISIAIRGAAASADVPADASNLAARAARAALSAALERGLATLDTGLSIELEKRIPSQAGLGGGSSDAAAAWIAAHAALSLPLDRAATDAALAALGSDCAFFGAAAATGFAICSGRGERVEPRPPPQRAPWIAWIAPAVAAPTAAVYARVEIPAHPRSLPAFDSSREFEIFNRLEEAALLAVPELANWRSALQRSGAPGFALSGSGSSFFALRSNEIDARRALAAALDAARAAGLRVRGWGIARASGHGAKLLLDS